MVEDVKNARHNDRHINPLCLTGRQPRCCKRTFAMIDYISLAIGHGLIAIALLRLVMRADLDVDPTIQSFVDKADAEREASRVSGRNAARRKHANHEQGQD